MEPGCSVVFSKCFYCFNAKSASACLLDVLQPPPTGPPPTPPSVSGQDISVGFPAPELSLHLPCTSGLKQAAPEPTYVGRCPPGTRGPAPTYCTQALTALLLPQWEGVRGSLFFGQQNHEVHFICYRTSNFFPSSYWRGTARSQMLRKHCGFDVRELDQPSV